MSPNFRKVAGQALVLIVAAFILFLLLRLLGDIHPRDVIAAIGRLSEAQITAAVLLTAFGYCWLIGYDYLALRFLKKHVPMPRLVFTSLSAFALQRNIGPAPITGGAVRYRYYSRFGFTAADGAIIATLCGLFFAMGIVVAGGLALLVQPHLIAEAMLLPAWLLRLTGAALLIGLAWYLYWSHARNHPIRIRSWELPAPSIGLAALQVLFGLIDLCVVAGVAYVLLPADVEVGYAAFLGMYVAAVLVGAISHVPGGMGVFESVLLLMMARENSSAVLGSLLAFRAIYYLLPLLTMGAATAVYEVGRRLLRLRRARA